MGELKPPLVRTSPVRSVECDVHQSEGSSSRGDGGEEKEEAPSGQHGVLVAQNVAGEARSSVGEYPDDRG